MQADKPTPEILAQDLVDFHGCADYSKRQFLKKNICHDIFQKL